MGNYATMLDSSRLLGQEFRDSSLDAPRCSVLSAYEWQLEPQFVRKLISLAYVRIDRALWQGFCGLVFNRCDFPGVWFYCIRGWE